MFSRRWGEDGSSSDEADEIITAPRSSSLFRYFQACLDPKLFHFVTLKRVPCEEDLMRTFRSQETNYWRESEGAGEKGMHKAVENDLLRASQRPTGVLTSRGDPFRAYSESIQSSEPITLKLFTRISLILRDDTAAIDALIPSGEPLEREPQDLNRESFWEAIAEKFNNPSLTLQLDLRDILENVDPSPTPAGTSHQEG